MIIDRLFNLMNNDPSLFFAQGTAFSSPFLNMGFLSLECHQHVVPTGGGLAPPATYIRSVFQGGGVGGVGVSFVRVTTCVHRL